jgi:hypothetical protein
MDFDLDEHGLPAFLDPAFDWLATKLPPTIVDNVVIPGLAHVFAFGSSLYDVAHNIAAQRPGAWDAEKLLPPVITLLGAYLALLSFYRSTRWLVRTMLWFMKWGTLFGALMGGVGYLAGQQGGGDALGGLQAMFASGASGVAKSVGAALWDAINAPGNDAPRQRRTRSRSQTTAKPGADRQTRSSTKPDPKAKAKGKAQDSKAKTQGSKQDDQAIPNLGDAQKIMGNIVGFAEKMGWMGAVRDAFGGGARNHDNDEL